MRGSESSAPTAHTEVASSIFTTPSPVSDGEDDKTYLRLCARISNRVQWIDDMSAELNLIRDKVNVIDTTKRIRVLHDVAATTQADLKQLQLLILRAHELPPQEHSLRVDQYQLLSTQLQQRLQRVTNILQSSEGWNPSNDNKKNDGLKQSSESYNLTKSLPGSKSSDVCSSMFVKINYDEEISQSCSPIQAFRNVQSDLEGIQKLANFFADEVHNAGEDLSTIESNLKETLLNTEHTCQEIRQTRDIQSAHRQNIAAFIAIPSILFAIILMLNH